MGYRLGGGFCAWGKRAVIDDGFGLVASRVDVAQAHNVEAISAESDPVSEARLYVPVPFSTETLTEAGSGRGSPVIGLTGSEILSTWSTVVWS